MSHTIAAMLELCKPLTVPRSRLLWDLGGMSFWAALALGLFIATAVDRNVNKGVLLLEVVPVAFLTGSARDFLNHLRAREIRLQKDGLETAGERGPQLLEWKMVDRVQETRGCSGGLILHGKRHERIFIPRVVTDYRAIRDHILQMTGQQNCGRTSCQSPTSGPAL